MGSGLLNPALNSDVPLLLFFCMVMVMMNRHLLAVFLLP